MYDKFWNNIQKWIMVKNYHFVTQKFIFYYEKWQCLHVRAHEWGIYQNDPYNYPIAIIKVRYGELWGARCGYTLKFQKNSIKLIKMFSPPGIWPHTSKRTNGWSKHSTNWSTQTDLQVLRKILRVAIVQNYVKLVKISVP